MAQLFSIDWHMLLTPDASIAGSFVRGSFVYLHSQYGRARARPYWYG